MIYAFGRWHKEESDYAKEEAARKAEEAERTRPMNFEEFTEANKQRFTTGKTPDILQLQIETVPADIRYFYQAAQERERERRRRGGF